MLKVSHTEMQGGNVDIESGGAWNIDHMAYGFHGDDDLSTCSPSLLVGGTPEDDDSAVG